MRLLLFLTAFFISIAVNGQVRSPESGRKTFEGDKKQGISRALVIGVSSYQYIDTLRFADDDAREFADYLLSNKKLDLSPGNVNLLLNEKARSGTILSAVTSLIESSKEGDRVYFYFAGHGDVEVTDTSNRGYLLVYDTPKNNYATGGISVDFLKAAFTAMTDKGAKLYIITDACRSGHLAGGQAGAKQTAESFSRQWENEIKILAAQPNQVSLESEEWGGGRGVFSFYLLKGLAGYSDFDQDSVITLNELEQYVGLQVTKATNKKQQPIFVGPEKFTTTIAEPDKQQMERYAEWKKDAEMKVLVVSGRGNQFADCSYYQELLGLTGSFIDSSRLNQAFKLYRSIGSCNKEVQDRARMELAAAIMNDIQQTVNQTLIGQKLVTVSEIAFTQSKIDSLFSLNRGKDPIYTIHFRNLKIYLDAVQSSLPGGTNLTGSYARSTLIPAIDSALHSESNAPYLFYAKAIGYSYGLHQFDTAIYYYKKAAEQSPTWLMPRLMIGMTYNKKGNFDSATHWLKGILSMDPAFRQFECATCFYASLGDVYLENKRYKESERYFKEAYRISPDNTDALYGMFYVAVKTNRKDDALQLFKELDELDTILLDKFDAEELMMEEKLLSKKDASDRVSRLRDRIQQQFEREDITTKEFNFLDNYLNYFQSLFKYYYEGRYSSEFDYLLDEFSQNAPDPAVYRMKIHWVKFDHEPSAELIDDIRETRERYMDDLSYDDLMDLNYMEAGSLIMENKNARKDDEEGLNELNRGIQLINELLDKGYVDCKFVEQLKRRVGKTNATVSLKDCDIEK